LLSAGEELVEVPAGVIAITWAKRVFYDPPPVFYRNGAGLVIERNLLDFSLEIIESRQGCTVFTVSNADICWRGKFSLGAGDLFSPASDEEPGLAVHRANEDITLQEYLNEEPPSFFCSDLSAIEGASRFPAQTALQAFADDLVEVIDWPTAMVDITREKPGAGEGISIFEWLQQRLLATTAEVIFCDDGAGEIADFITIEETADGPRVKMYHCKASGGPQAGNRVDDLYEVCGQAVKSSVWIRTEQLLARLRHRTTLPSITGFVRGDEDAAVRILALQARQQTQFEIYIVQPSVQRQGRNANISNLLAATRDYLLNGGIDTFGIIGS
jgi:hypothetical protein